MGRLTGSIRLARRPAVRIAAPSIAGDSVTSPFAAYGAIAHWDAQYNIKQSAGVSRWTDLVGGYTLSQTTAANQPTYSTSDTTFASGHAITFTGSGPHYLSADVPDIQALFEGASSPLSVAAVAAATDDANTKVLFAVGDTAGANNWWYLGHTASESLSLSISDGSYDEVASTSTNLTAAHYGVYTFDGANTAEAILNGFSEATDSGFFETPVGLDTTAIGTRVISSVLTPGFDGKLRDIVIFNDELTGANLAAVNILLAQRAWGWRGETEGLVDMWSYGFRESLVSGDLDAWTGRVGNSALTAPSAGQRPTDSGTGWVGDPGSSIVIRGSGPASSFNNTTEYTVIIAAKVDNYSSTYSLGGFFNSGDDNQFIALSVESGTGRLKHDRKDGPGAADNQVASTAVGVDTFFTGAMVLDGSADMHLYLNGVSDATPVAVSNSPSVSLDRTSLFAFDRPSIIQHHDGVIYEMQIFDRALSASEILAIHNNLSAEYS